MANLQQPSQSMLLPLAKPVTGSTVSILAGFSLTLAFAPFNYYWLAPLCMALLLLVIRSCTPRQAASRGLLFGIAHFGSGVYWVTISLNTYGGAPLVFAISATALLALYMACYPAVFCYLVTQVAPTTNALSLILVAPALWVGLEWTRGVLFTGFPWLSLGYSQTDSVLRSFAPLVGVYGITAIVMVFAGAGLAMLRRTGLGAAAGALTIIALLASAYGLSTLQWTVAAGDPIAVTVVQGNIDQRQKFEPDALDRTIMTYVEQSMPVAADSDVIIWPETALPTFFDQLDEEFIRVLRAQARLTKTDYLAGVPAGDWQSGEYFNAVVHLNGGEPAFYHKRRLLPFGEFLPLRALFNLFHRFVDIPLADFTPGADQQPAIIAGGQPVGISICFEAAFGSEIRRALPHSTWLVNVSNDGWFGDSLAPHQHLQIIRFRSLENGRPMARSTNTGISALINADGEITASAPPFKVTSLTGRLQPRSGETPYGRFGDQPILFGVIAILLVWLVVFGIRARAPATGQ